MQTVNIEKKKLLDILKKNRKQHEKEYNEALVGYHQKVVSGLKQALADAISGKKYMNDLDLTSPQEHLGEYDSNLRMLELSADKIITLTQFEFNQFVMDLWVWKDQFSTTNAFYSSH